MGKCLVTIFFIFTRQRGAVSASYLNFKFDFFKFKVKLNLKYNCIGYSNTMEKRINTKTRTYLHQFKKNIKDVLENTNSTEADKNTILQMIYDYQPLEFTKADFQKRKRVKNIVPFFERCRALRANGEQCTRRKKDSDKFCGTHIKGIPHGEINQVQKKPTHIKRVVWAQDIKGIIYYIDDSHNVYHPQDIMSNSVDPKIIAKYIKEGEKYSIPSLYKL